MIFRRRRTNPKPAVSESVIHGHNIQLGNVGGNVTILLDRPGYRVEFLVTTGAAASEPVPDRPSYLLDPQHQVVPYLQRDAEQTRLREWLEDRQERVSVLMLTGPGGQGKTRLAGHVAAVWHEEGWVTAQAVPTDAQPQPLGPASARADALDDDQPLLLVIDYVERWRPDVLTRLVKSIPVDHPTRTVRVLMLSRPGVPMWKMLAAELDRTGIDLAPQVTLGEFTTDREAAFAVAARAFAARIGRPGQRHPAPPGNLAEAAFASPLTLHMAALAAVYDMSASESAPSERDPQALSQYLLRHERRHWRALATASAGAGVIEQVVWWATLFGPMEGRRGAIRLLRDAGLADGDAEAGRLLDVHEQLYFTTNIEPSGRDANRQVTVATLAPLRPDRLGEDFVGEHLTDSPHAVEALVELIGAEDGTLGLRRCMIVLAASADRHPAAAETLWTLLDRWPSLAAQGGAGVVQFVADRASTDLAGAVDATLPEYSSELLVAAADLAQRLMNDLPTESTPDQHAARLLHLGNRVADLGRYDEARSVIMEAIEIYRQLAPDDASCWPRLANALSSLCKQLVPLNRLPEAIRVAYGALAIFKRLAVSDPSGYEPDLAAALGTVGRLQLMLDPRDDAFTRLPNIGRFLAARSAIVEAIGIYRRLAAANPVDYEPFLAEMLSYYGKQASTHGRELLADDEFAAAPDAGVEAVGIYRRLAAADPATYEPRLVAALDALSSQFAELGQHDGALSIAKDALEIHRRLAVANPTVFQAGVADALTAVAERQLALGRRDEALSSVTEAVDIHCGLLDVNAGHQLGLALALSMMARLLAERGRHEEAFRHLNHAVALRRKLSTTNPSAHEPHLAGDLRALGNVLRLLGHHDGASAALREAVEIYRRLAAANRRYADDLRQALIDLGSEQPVATSNAVIIELLKRHVLHADEGVQRVKEWPDGVAVTTTIGRHLVGGPEPDELLISREPWVRDVVIAIRDDLVIHGQPERFGFVLLADGSHIYVNSAADVAKLGRRLADSMNPTAYAEILVQFHPYSSATRTLLTEAGELRRRFARAELPDNNPIRLRQTPDAVVLTFDSLIQYEKPGSVLNDPLSLYRSVNRIALCDIMSWTVTVPHGEPAEWTSRLVAEGVNLDP